MSVHDERELPPFVQLSEDGFMLDTMGFCLPKKEWNEIRNKLNAGYASVTEEEITSHNQYLIRSREEDLARMYAEPTPKKPVEQVGYIYLVKSNQYYKIGRSKNVPERVKQLGLITHPVDLVCKARVQPVIKIEADLHEQFSYARYRGEWFKLSQEDVDKIVSFLSHFDEFSTSSTYPTTTTSSKKNKFLEVESGKNS